MAIIINENGATIDTQIENFNRIKSDILSNIDPNLTFESNTIAGVFTNLVAFIERQLSEAVLNVRNQLNPLTATGVALDILTIFFPNIKRRSATYTVQNITITTTLNNVSLIGLDTSPDGNNAFTVSDVNNNEYYLQTGITIATAGTNTYSFRAKKIGNVSSALNTIININTPVNGVLNINNATPPTTQGVQEETDATLLNRILLSKTFRQKDITEIELALLNLDGVANVKVYQNRSTIIQNDIPANHIYVVIEGGIATDIGNTINNTAPAGIPLFGSESVNIYENNLPVVIYYNNVVVVNIYAKLDIQISTNNIVNTDLLKEYIVNKFVSTIGNNVVSGDIIYLAESYLQNNAGVVNCQLSLDNVSFTNILTIPNLKTRFAITTANITINIL